MPTFKEFLDFLFNSGILISEHINFLQGRNPPPSEESDILWTLTDFFKTLDANNFFQISSSLYKKFLESLNNPTYSKDLSFFRSIINSKPKTSAKKLPKTQSLTEKPKSNGKITTSPKYDKLYSDSLHKEESLKIKQETHMKHLLKNCTFVPEINQNKIISEKLKVPVFERLSKQPPKNTFEASETQKEMAEIQECTFRPQILKYIAANNNIDGEAKAFQRLYENADIIRQNLKQKKQNYEEMAVQELNFVPEINESSSRIMNKKRAETKESPYERLYQISVDKKRKGKNDGESYRNEEVECTFHPETFFTEDYQKKSKILQETKNSNIFDRLYNNKLVEGSSEKKQEQQIEKRPKPKDETPIFNKLYNQRNLKLKKQEEIKKEYMKEIGATFKPKINERKKSPLSKSFVKEKKTNDTNKPMNKSFSTQSLRINSSEKKEKTIQRNTPREEKKKSKYIESEMKKGLPEGKKTKGGSVSFIGDACVEQVGKVQQQQA